MCARETTPISVNRHFPGSLYLPHQLSNKESCCSLGLCGTSSPHPVQYVVSDLPSPEVIVEPCRAVAHLSAASGNRSTTTSLLTGRGYSGHVRHLMTNNRTKKKNCTKKLTTKRQITARLRLRYASILWVKVLSLPPYLLSPLSRDHQSFFLSLRKVSAFDEFTLVSYRIKQGSIIKGVREG